MGRIRNRSGFLGIAFPNKRTGLRQGTCSFILETGNACRQPAGLRYVYDGGGGGWVCPAHVQAWSAENPPSAVQGGARPRS